MTSNTLTFSLDALLPTIYLSSLETVKKNVNALILIQWMYPTVAFLLLLLQTTCPFASF